MKLLIIGSEGQLGKELMKLYPEAEGTSHNPSKSNYLPLESSSSIRDLIRKQAPEVIINAAALTNVDRCEREKSYAYQVNGLAVKSISQSCIEMGARLVHISTDYVFDGSEGNYQELSPPHPINYYGLSKLSGDQFAFAYSGNLVVRTSGVFGYSNNFPLFVYKKLMQGERINAIKAFYSPIHAKNLALAVKKLVSLNIEGIINVAGERISRFEFASKIAGYFDLDMTLLKESDQVTQMQAIRPFDSSLNIERAKKLVDFDFYGVRSNLDALQESISSMETKD